MNVLQRGGSSGSLVVADGKRQQGKDLSGAEGDADIDHPNKPVIRGILMKWSAKERGQMLDPCDGEPCNPVNDGLGTGRFGQPKVMAQHAKNSRNGSKADTRRKEEFQSDLNHLRLGAEDWHFVLLFLLFQLCLIFLCLGFISIAFTPEPGSLFAKIAILIPTTNSLCLPLLSAFVCL